jgi:hypothetical protein
MYSRGLVFLSTYYHHSEVSAPSDPWSRRQSMVQKVHTGATEPKLSSLVDIPCFKLISSASTKPLPVLGPSKNPTIACHSFSGSFFSVEERSNTYIIATHLLALRSSPVATRSKTRRRLVAIGRIANDSRFVKDTWTNPFAPSGTLWRKAFYSPFVARHNFCHCCHILWSASHLLEKPSIRW